MPEYISDGKDWYHISPTEKASVQSGTTTVATIVTAVGRPKKKQ